MVSGRSKRPESWLLFFPTQHDDKPTPDRYSHLGSLKIKERFLHLAELPLQAFCHRHADTLILLPLSRIELTNWLEIQQLLFDSYGSQFVFTENST
jgi:hypothetical protein